MVSGVLGGQRRPVKAGPVAPGRAIPRSWRADEGQPFRFISPERLLQDFFRDVDVWLEVES